MNEQPQVPQESKLNKIIGILGVALVGAGSAQYVGLIDIHFVREILEPLESRGLFISPEAFLWVFGLLVIGSGILGDIALKSIMDRKRGRK